MLVTPEGPHVWEWRINPDYRPHPLVETLRRHDAFLEPPLIAADIGDLRPFYPDDPIYDISPPNPCEGGA